MPELNEQHIDDYLSNKMDHQMRMDFEKELTSNKELQEELAIRAALIKGVKSAGKDHLKERLKIIHQKVNKPPSKHRRIWPFFAGIAASLALLISSGLYFFNHDQISIPELYAANYEVYPLNLSTRESTDKALSLLNEQYKNKEYKAALALIEKELVKNPQNARLLMGAGICLLELGQAAKARSYLSKIIETNDLRLSDIARWYSALTYLKDGNVAETQDQLLPLINHTKADRHKEAKGLYNQLKQY